jgi:spore cortex protein
LHKKIVCTLSTAFLLGSLAACNTNEGAMEDNTYYSDATRPIGYYSDENIDTENGNAYLPERDNDGPIVEMLDRTDANNDRNLTRNNGNMFGRNVNYNNDNNRTLGTTDDGFIGEDHTDSVGNSGIYDGNEVTDIKARGEYGQYSNRHTLNDYGNNKGVNNPTRPYAVRDNGMNRDNRYSRTDYNYHGQMATKNNAKRSSYYNNYDGELSEQISNRVQNIPTVDDVRTIVTRDQVLIALDTKDHDGKEVKAQIRKQIQNMTNGKTVRIVTDPAIFTRARNIDNDLHDGGPTSELDADVRDMFREIGNQIEDAVETPFRNER